MIDRQKVEEATKLLLEGLGVDLADHNFRDTPSRVARAYVEIFEPPDLDIPVFDEQYTDIVLLRGHEFYTMCPHHLLPVRIVASIAYMPNGKVIGASKLLRMVHDVNRTPMTQERLTREVAERVQDLAEGALGVAVFMKGEHGCMKIRGIRSSAADMITTHFIGQYEYPRPQEMFLRFVSNDKH